MSEQPVAVRFVLVAEGSSDGGLVSVLRDLCVRQGAAEAMGEFPRLDHLQRKVGKRHLQKVEAALELLPDTNLVFVHRDADAHDPEDVRREIASSLASLREPIHVPVVPVRETEAWLLVDEGAIREVVGNPRGTIRLELPPPDHVEDVPDPKAALKRAVVLASELSGRRRDRIAQDFPRYRRDLLARLDPDGPVRQLPAWQRLEADLRSAIVSLRG